MTNTDSSTSTSRNRRPFSPIDRAILALHALVAVSFGVIGLVSATDVGWGDLQRVAVVMLTLVWLVGVAATGLVARLVYATWLRGAVLLAGPVIALVVFVMAAVR